VRHIPEYAANPDAELAGYFDLNLERAEQLAHLYGGKAFASYQDLLADPSIDAVSVCTANSSHAEISIAALRAGKHVLCEKPMATTQADCDAMVQAAEESGRYLMIGQNQRLAKAHVKAKELIDSGLIGEIISFRTTFGHGGPETWSVDPGKSTWFFDKNRAAMGAMAELGIHKTDLIHYLTGDHVVETTAHAW
jgi:predicted dehydrogenase